MSRYDWSAIQLHYDAGHNLRECAERFGFSSGALHHAVGRGLLRVAPGELDVRPRGVTRERVAVLHRRGLAQVEIAQRLGVSKSTVAFHLRRLGVPADPAIARRFDWVEIRMFYDAGHSLRECVTRFGFSRSAWADAVGRGAIVPRPRLEPIEQILAAGRRRNRTHVKWRLLSAGLKGDRCEICGAADWRGRQLSLELHHVNGDGLDNRLENLQLLCPNCHSQTDTWGARNKGRVPP